MLPVVGTADRATVLAAVTVFQAMATARRVGVTDLGALRVAGNTQIIELTAIGVQVQGESAVTGFQFAGTAAGGVGAAVAQFASAVDALDRRVRNAVVEGVDHAADGIAAI